MPLPSGSVLILLSAGILLSARASAAHLPDFDIKGFCRTHFNEDDPSSKLEVEDCVDNESVARVQLQQMVGALSDDVVQNCVKSASVGPSGAGSYLVLLGCIDAEQAEKSTGGAAAGDHREDQPVSMGPHTITPVGAAATARRSPTDALSGVVPAEPENAKMPRPALQFDHDLGLNSVDPEVKQLQIFLNTHGFPVAADGPGSSGHEVETFGPSTKAALKKFQKAHTKELGVGSSTGHFGPTTRNYLNGL